MSNNKQTAVDKLIQVLIDRGFIDSTYALPQSALWDVVEQAKVQHKQEIIDAYRVGAAEVHMIGLHKPEVYYTETYSPSLHGGEMTMNNNPGTTTTINTQELETLMIMYLDGIEFYGTDGEWVEARTVLESFMRYINTLDK
jgi:hypothetical protein